MVRWKTVSSWVLRFLVLGVAILLPAISMADHVGILDVSPRSFVANKKGQFLFLRGGDGIQNGTEVFFGSLGGPKAKAVPYKNTSWFKVAVPSLPEGPVDLLVNDPATGHQDRLSDHLHPITGDPLSLMFFSGGGNKAQASASLKESAENARSDATAAFEGIQAGVQPILDADNPELQSALSSAILGADLTDPQALLGLLLGGFGGGVDESVFGHAFDVNPGPPPTITDRGNIVDPNTIVITVLTDPNLTIVVIDSSTEEEKVRDVTIAGGPNEIDATVHTRSSTDADTGDFLADVMIHYADAITDPVDAALTIDGKVDFGQQGQKLLVKAPVNISLDLYREATAYLAHVMGLLDVSVLVTLKSDFSKITVKPTIIAYISASDSTGSSLPIFTLTGKGNAQLKGLAEDLSFATASLSFSTVSSGGKFFARGTPAGTLKAALKNRVKLANATLEDLIQLFQFTGKAEIKYRDKAQSPTLFFELTP